MPAAKGGVEFLRSSPVLAALPAKELAALATLARDEKPQPPWVRPWSLLLLGRLHDLEGERARAVVQYKKVLEEPYGQEELRARAREGLRRPFTRNDHRSGPPPPGSTYPT